MYICLYASCLWASAGTFGECQGLPPCLRGSADPDRRTVFMFPGEPLAHLCFYSVAALAIKPWEPCCLSTIDGWQREARRSILSQAFNGDKTLVKLFENIFDKWSLC